MAAMTRPLTDAAPRTDDAQRFDSLEAGRAIAAICVMLFHIAGTMPLPQHFGVKPTTLFDAGGLGVEYFFVLSGFVMMASHGADIGRPGAAAPYLWRRFRRIYLPMWPVVLGMVLVYVVMPHTGRGIETQPGTILSAMLLLPIAGQEVINIAWTLRHEVIFYLLFGLLLYRPLWGAAGLALLGLISAIAFATAPSGMRGLVYFNAINLLFLFGLGAALLHRRISGHLGVGLLAAGLALIAYVWVAALRDDAREDALITIGMGLGAVLTILGAVACERAGLLRVPRWLAFLGQASYAIYLVHMPAISLLAKVMVALAPMTAWSPWPVFAVLAAWGLAAGIAFHLWVERPLLRLVPASLPRPALAAADPK
ncbi:acyltransferase family protein [Zavarzinia sp. CC-PAN008]|uniref:acyltransferase family protein n=1 Tax=Zavarzinia sp. CC-PAN008 TaxID=3243332 RepID=UPI003F746982